MYAIERQAEIISLLEANDEVNVNDLASRFDVSKETIRRDLRVMENQGLVIRTHGGAVLADDINMETSIEIRESINIRGKDAIGRIAASLVKDGDTLFLDASTSSLYVAKHLKEKRGLTVITNAERIVLELAQCDDITLISSGGYVRKKSLSSVGRAAENAISSYHADKVFFSCKGFSPKLGATDSNEQEAGIRRLMIQCSGEAVFLCDHTKFNKVGYTATAQLSDISRLIADIPMPEGWEEEIKSRGVEVMIAFSDPLDPSAPYNGG